MKEEWRDVPGYEGLYKVSNSGHIKSLARWQIGKNGKKRRFQNWHIKKQSITSNGYKVVSLSKKGKSRYWHVHRLVAITFIPNPDNLPVINHKDECKTNNRVENLEWCTSKYNMNYGKMSCRKDVGRKAVEQYDMDGRFMASYDSITDAANAVGTSRDNIGSCIRGRNGKWPRRTAVGFIWKLRGESAVDNGG